MKKNILITNDDGFSASGLEALVEALKDVANIIVVAPKQNKSACSHSMTLTHPLRFKPYKKDCYYIEDGTPTDCVFLALNALYDKNNKPDLVISGINIGSNMGEDITYSGTVAGAMEAVLQGVPSIAISQVKKENIKLDFSLAKKIIVDMVVKIFNDDFPLNNRKLLNINIPPCSIEQYNGISITKAGSRVYGDDLYKYNDPRGDEFYFIGLHPLLWNESSNQDCDFEAIKQNKVSITPITLDLTSYNDIDILNRWIK